jgi:hypothetical protein
VDTGGPRREPTAPVPKRASTKSARLSAESCFVRDDDVHVDWAGLRIWNAATNGPIVSPPGDV